MEYYVEFANECTMVLTEAYINSFNLIKLTVTMKGIGSGSLLRLSLLNWWKYLY